MWYVASPNRPLPSLFKLWPLGKSWPRLGVTCFILRKHEKIFVSETTSPRDLIFGMYHELVDLYRICSNYAYWFNEKSQ